MAQLQVIKVKRGMVYSRKEKMMIINVFKYFRQQQPEISISQAIRETSKATGCSEGSIYQFRKEESSEEGFKEPTRRRAGKYFGTNSRDVKYNDNVRSAIREIVYNLKSTNMSQTLNSILKIVNVDSQLPEFRRTTLRRLLLDMGFRYSKVGNKSVLIEVKQTASIAQPPKQKPRKARSQHIQVKSNNVFSKDNTEAVNIKLNNQEESSKSLTGVCVDISDTKLTLDEIDQKPLIIELNTKLYSNKAAREMCIDEDDQKPTITDLNIEECSTQKNIVGVYDSSN